MITYNKYDLGDELYFVTSDGCKTVSGKVTNIKISYSDIIRGGINVIYTIKGYNFMTDISQDRLFKTQEECEKTFVLMRFGHLFKDTKTLK